MPSSTKTFTPRFRASQRDHARRIAQALGECASWDLAPHPEYWYSLRAISMDYGHNNKRSFLESEHPTKLLIWRGAKFTSNGFDRNVRFNLEDFDLKFWTQLDRSKLNTARNSLYMLRYNHSFPDHRTISRAYFYVEALHDLRIYRNSVIPSKRHLALTA